MNARQPHDLGAQHIKPRQGGGKADRLGQPMLGQAAGLAALQIGMQNPGAGLRALAFIGIKPAILWEWQAEIILFLGKIGNQSSPS
jgi:hypothetical protein